MFAVSLHSACAMRELSLEVMNRFIALLPTPHLPEGSFLHVLQEIQGSQGGAEHSEAQPAAQGSEQPQMLPELQLRASQTHCSTWQTTKASQGCEEAR